MVAVVFQHVAVEYRLAVGFAVWSIPVLFLVSGYLAARSDSGLKRKLQRILVPYFAWGTFYTLLLAAAQGRAPTIPSVPAILTGGGVFFVLWFLPMLALASTVGHVIRPKSRINAAILLFALSLVLALAQWDDPAGTVVRWQGWVASAPHDVGTFLLGMYLGGRPDVVERAVKYRWWWAVCAATGVVVTALLVLRVPRASSVGEGYPIGVLAVFSAVGLLLLALSWPHFRLPESISSTALGVYVMHMGWLYILRELVPQDLLEPVVWVPVMVVLVVSASVASSKVAMRSRVLSRLVS